VSGPVDAGRKDEGLIPPGRRGGSRSWFPSVGLALLLLPGCAGQGRDPSAAPSWSRLSLPGRPEPGASDIAVESLWEPGSGFESLALVRFAPGGGWQPYVEVPLLSFRDRPGEVRTSLTGDRVYGLRGSLAPRDSRGRPLPDAWAFGDLGFRVFAVDPAGNPKGLRWPGLLEGERALASLLSTEWRVGDYAVATGLGAALVGIRGRGGRNGRAILGLALDRMLPSTGFGLATEETRLRIETNWILDPAGNRLIGEVAAGLSFAVGSWQWDLAWRQGLADSPLEGTLFLGFQTRMVEAWF